jgi:hypothetical protein
MRNSFSVRLGKYNGNLGPLPMSEALFKKIAPFARISDVYIDVMNRKTAMHVYVTPQVHQHTVPTPLNTVQIRNQYLSKYMDTKRSSFTILIANPYLTGFIFQSIPGIITGICTCASFTYHFPTRQMYAFMHCLPERTCESFCTAIEQGSLRQTPFLVPNLIIQFNLDTRLNSLEIYHETIYGLERDLNVRYSNEERGDFREMGFEVLIKEVNRVTTNLAYISFACQGTTRQLSFLDSVAERYHTMALLNDIPELEADEVKRVLLENQAYLRCWNEGLKDRAEYLSKRGQALVQTVRTPA